MYFYSLKELIKTRGGSNSTLRGIAGGSLVLQHHLTPGCHSDCQSFDKEMAFWLSLSLRAQGVGQFLHRWPTREMKQ